MRKRPVRFQPKEAPLREDVRVLGALVGDVLKEQGGAGLFRSVEAARKAAIRRREGEAGAEAALHGIVHSLPAAQAAEFVRAFSTYFQVVNLAESIHRIRRRRTVQRSGKPPRRGTLTDVVQRLRSCGWSLPKMQALLDTLLIEPVFTSHPTQATRRSILEKQQRIARRLVERLDPSRTPQEERTTLARIRAEITAGWQTEETPTVRPSVSDELENLLFYLADIIYRIVPPFYENLEAALEGAFGKRARTLRIPVLVRFSSWVGGDMDGNPNVTPQTIRSTLSKQRGQILERYRREALDLSRQLTQSLSRVGVDPRIPARLRRYARLFPKEMQSVPPRHRGMPYRVLLQLVAARLEATARDAKSGYGAVEEMLDDLNLIECSLRANAGTHAGLFTLSRLRRRVETFGFHMATLDVRQDARLHRRAVGCGLGVRGWTMLPVKERLERIRKALRKGERLRKSSDPDLRLSLETYGAVAEGRRRHGERAIGAAIVSMTQGVDDVLSVLLLARWGGLAKSRQQVPLDVAPLFETIADLEAAPGILETLLQDPIYRRHLAGRANRQVVMIGYSDSNKDGGLAASRWVLHAVQEQLVRRAEAAGVDLTLFHGRGGTISRGGGKTQRAVMAAARGAVQGRLRVTEQGEVIHAKYGLRSMALRTLDLTTGVVALATALPPRQNDSEGRWRTAMETIAGASREAYRGLLYDDARGLDYFRQATPIDVIERMPIGSRPASRGARRSIEDLRAIPWVFAWTQSRHLLPGWYGLGAGLQAAAKRHGKELLCDMARNWRFFRALLDDAEMVLSKADMAIAARYSGLADAKPRTLFREIRGEFDRTVGWVLELKEIETLLDRDPVLQRSIRLRNPYVDPMSLLQVDLLKRWRASGRSKGDLFHALQATINGIARGLQNTG